MGVNNHSCYYNRCWLPEDNSKYLWQIVFIVLSTFILLKDITNFSFIPIFLFVFPIMIDILTTELKSKVCTCIRWLFGVANVILLVCCVLGFFDIIIDAGDCFSLAPAFMLYNGITVKKVHIAKMLIADILVPFVFFISAPSRKTLYMLEKTQKLKCKPNERR